MTQEKVAVVGLGAMGGGMARVLVRAGFAVMGFDVVGERELAFAKESGVAADPEALADVSAVLLMVVNAAQVEATLFDDNRFGPGGLMGRLSPDAVVINAATVPPSFARQVAGRVGGDRYLDCPVSGGTARAAEGDLAILAAGTETAFARADAVLTALARTVYRLGTEPGKGSAMKAVNQLLAGVHIVAAAEAITFGMSQGLDPGEIIAIIDECAGNSWMLQNRGPHIRDGDYTPLSAVEIFVKDLGLVDDIAREARFSAPLTAAALTQFLAASGSGLGREDDAAVAKVYARNGGITLPGDAA
ncbi:L-threonate dehydrogenase [Acuticoccus mangrovi]|uniref:L-threonate dehydrogenase n=1 Tax=Acuticoccus mangrovi TaxID=2796142 RepID=A0A934MGL9_9HYPH|nr:L-threonate dehydrogenase [Acuticoccus mangrovi]MBJ3776050.1 NAD-binding protein [Acuticoccus mangrovi]